MFKIAKSITDSNSQNLYVDKNLFYIYGSGYNGEDMPSSMDYQGIQWKTDFPHVSRKILRQQRVERYKPFRQFEENELTTYPSKEIKREEPYYSFEKFYKGINLWNGHFQLKHNLLVPTKTDFIYPFKSGFVHYSLIDFKEKKFIIEEDIHPVGIDYINGIVGLSTLGGELVLYDLQKGNLICKNQIISENSINNCVKFFKQKGLQGLKVGCGGNDCSIYIYDLNNEVELSQKIVIDNPVNTLRISPDGNLILVLEDQTNTEIIDLRIEKTVIQLVGHEDYGFSGDWHPDGIFVATGNQDKTCRIWDIRKPNKEFNILPSRLGSACSLKYSNSGSYLVMGESIDFVNIYNVEKNYEEMQVIDYFGETIGFNFDEEDGDSLFIGVMVESYNGVFEYNLKRTEYLNTLSDLMF